MEDAGEDSSETGSFNPSPDGFFGPDDRRNNPKVGIRKVGLRAEIDTSPPFGSVKEAVDHFENSASWIHLHRLRFGLADNAYLHNIGEIDMKKVEEQTLELEKNLIVKELETLDVLEELGTTKRIVEDLKWQLRKEALKSIATPDSSEQVSTPTFEELKGGNSIHFLKNDGPAVGSSSPCPNSSPDVLLLELNQAKMNLGKTINELGWIQSSVESLNKKIKKEKALLERNHQRLTSNPAGASVLRDKPKQQRMKPSEFSGVDLGMFRNFPNNAQEIVDECATFGASQAAAETQQMNPHMKTAEMRLIAAKKMEEAARAAEAVALAEIKALSSKKDSLDFPLPEPETLPTMQSPLPSSKPQKRINLPKENAEDATVFQVDGANNSKLGILKKLEDASEEVKLSRQALEEALKRIDIANRKQLAAGEALRNYATPPDHHPQHPQLIDMSQLTKPQLPLPNEAPKPVLRSTVSMRDVLNRKQVLPRDYMERRETESHKVALSQMLNELRQDLSCPAKVDENRRKQFIAQRKRFGFIHISFPLTKQGKKNMPSSDRK